MLLLLLACPGKDTDADETDVVDDAPLADAYELEGDDVFPEAIAWDPQTRRFFASSLAHGNILAIAPDGAQTVFAEGDGATDRATLGVEIDVARRRLWTCAIIADGALPGTIWVYDVDSGAQIGTFVLEDTFPDASCNDLAFDADGIAYVTDRENPNIYRIDLATETVSLWATDPLLSGDLIGMNGIELSPDGAALLAVVYLPSRLVRIPLADPAAVTEVALGGDPFQGGGPLSGADGTAIRGDTLYVAMEDRVVGVVADDASWAAGTATAIQVDAKGLSAITVAEDRLFVANGQAVQFVVGSAPELPFRIFEVEP